MSGRPDGHADAALPEETVLSIEDQGDTEFHPFDEVKDEFQPGPMNRVMGPDGLPITVAPQALSLIPALSPATLVCMGDFSEFVQRDGSHNGKGPWVATGHILKRLRPEQVERLPNGRWVEKGTNDDVEPLRPPCRHYVRQKGQMELNAEATQLYRLCGARRTTEGTFMSIRDYGMYACDMREPFDLASAEQLDEFDRMKVQQGKERRELPMLAPAPARPQTAPDSLGIFGSDNKE
jgi:hypothetical protein